MIRRHIETITDIARGARIHCLPFFGEQPVNINLRSVRVRRAIEDRQTAGRGTDVRAFFQLPNIDDLDRHSLLCALFSQTIGKPESDRIAPLAEHVDLLSIIPEQGKALTGDRSNKFQSELRMEKKESESRLAWTGLARVICDDFSLSLGIQQIFIRFEFFRVGQSRIDKQGTALKRRHDQSLPSRIEESQSAI